VVSLVREPLVVHQQGFWLSFGAVAILLLVYRMRRRSGGALRELVRAQLALSVGMLPLVALTTATVPWTGVPANLLAVPVVSLAVVPVNLLGGTLAPLWPQAAELAFRLADLALGALLRWLEWLALAPAVPLAATGGALLVAQAGALAWLLGVPRRYLPVLAACCALPLAPRAPALDHGTYRVTALDVGQGTAVLVETRHHRLLYDAGPGYPSGFETGSAVVVPSLRATGRPRLDTVILSHDDLDHVGGARAVLASVPVAELLTGMPAQGGVSCHGRQWRWDGVDFRVLAVARPAAASDNDRSCVLLVDDGRYRALLAGDVGTAVERRLVRALPPVQLMFAPHHGSLTSSSPALVRVLRPAVVFVSAGRNNRFGHPHPQVVARYRQVGAQLHQTGRHGALIWQSDRPEAVVRWRRDRSPYWRAREGGSVSSR
jgi:competence protein ComEC